MLKIFLIFSLFIVLVLSLDDFTRRDVTFGENLTKEEARKIQDGLKAEIRERLAGGTVASDTDFPFAADIVAVWPNGNAQGCSGAIIATFIILTSRDCMFSDSLRISPTDVFVQVGSAIRGPARFGTFVSSATWLDRWEMPQGPHPNFAIANLRDFLQMSPTVNVIRLPSLPQSTMSFDFQMMDIAGWGPVTGTNLHFGRPIVLQFSQRPTVAGITDYELAFQAGSALSFEPGDNGGPVVLREGGANTLIGTLWTQRSSPAGNSITFMQIGQFWDFIHDVTGIPRRFS